MAEIKDDDLKPGYKADTGKARIGLLDSHALTEIARVMTYGAQKYSVVNWRRGMDWSRVFDAIQRHLLAWNDGENIDSESGLPHLAHAGAGITFLLWYSKHKPEFDDRHNTLIANLEDKQ